EASTPPPGLAPFTFTRPAGTLPPGRGLASDGTLAGTPTTTGSSSFTVSVSDASGVPGSRAYTMSVSCPVITIAPSSLPDGQLGSPYAQTLTAAGGTGPYGFSIQSG